MTFPDLSPYFVDDDMDMKRRIEESYRQSITLQQQFWNEADIDTRFNSGDQTLWNQLYGAILPIQSRRTFQFNRIRRVVNMVEGYQRRNRKSSIVVPVHSKDQQGADDMTGVLQWCYGRENAYNTISDAFHGACVTGLALISVWMDYRFDPINGDIRIDKRSFNSVMIDPTFKKQDLSDANYIWTRKWMSKKQIISLLPDHEKDIMAMPYTANRDDKFIYLPENYQYSMRNLLPYDEYWYLDYRPVKLLIDPETGETKEWEGEEKELKQFLEAYPTVKVTTIQKQTCKLAISVGNKVMFNGPNPFGIDRYPFVGVYCYFEPEIPYFALKMQGIVRGLRDAQFLYNRKKVIECDILESQINSGLKYKESALIDPNDAFLSGQGRALALRDSASMDDVQVIQPPGIQPGMMELSKMLGDEIAQISGVNEELLGSATDEKAGILSMMRQGAGLTTLQGVFDQLDMSQKLLGDICIEMIQANFSKGKVEKILGRPASPEFEDKLFPKYDAQVEEGALTTTQKQMQFQQLMSLREAGINIPESVIIDAAQLQNKKELLDAMQAQSEGQQQQEQQAQEGQQETQRVLNETLMAKAESDHALAQERMNKLGLDQALSLERIQRAEEERDNATLAKIKAAKEIESMDINHLHEMLAVLKSIKEHEAPLVTPQAATPQPVMPSQANQGQALASV